MCWIKNVFRMIVMIVIGNSVVGKTKSGIYGLGVNCVNSTCWKSMIMSKLGNIGSLLGLPFLHLTE